MKKIISLTVIIIGALTMSMSCSIKPAKIDNSLVVGTWNLQKIEINEPSKVDTDFKNKVQNANNLVSEKFSDIENCDFATRIVFTQSHKYHLYYGKREDPQSQSEKIEYVFTEDGEARIDPKGHWISLYLKDSSDNKYSHGGPFEILSVSTDKLVLRDMNLKIGKGYYALILTYTKSIN